MIYVNLLLITFIVVNIIDISGFIDSVKIPIKKLLDIRGDIRIKPFDCSYCMTFWSCIFYLIFTDNISLILIAYTLLLSFLTPIIKDIQYSFMDMLIKVLEKLK